MSWVDRVQQGIIIKTGDGKEYKPLYLNAAFQVEYQNSTFEFIGVDGTLVKKTTKIGVRYNLEIYFGGPDHLDTVRQFIASCNDRRPWTVAHPLYDSLTVQVTSLNCDDALYDPSKITGTMIETLPDGEATVFLIPIDQVAGSFDVTIDALTNSLTTIPDVSDVNRVGNDTLSAYKKGVPIISNAIDFELFTNAYNTALNYLNTATATPLLMMRSAMDVLAMPSKFAISATARVNLLLSTLSNLEQSIFGLFTKSSKQIFQNEAGATLAAVCLAATSPIPGDYPTTTTILGVIDSLIDAQDQYISDLDALQSDNGGTTQSFVPDAAAIIELTNLVNLTVSALYSLSLSAKSERSIVLANDTNWIVLAHQLYGLDFTDNNLNGLITQNNSTLSEYLQVEKGRRIVYYV